MPPPRGRGSRRYGVGTYDQTTDGRHRWRYTTRLASGQTTRIDRKARDIEVLDAKVKEVLEQERQLGHVLEIDQRTVRQYCEHWLEQRVSIRNEASTKIKYGHDLRRILPYIGHYKVQQLTADDVQTAIVAMTNERTNDGAPRYSATTIARSVQTLRNAFNTLVLTGRLTKNPVNIKDKHVDLPKPAEEYEPIVFDVQQLLELLDAARGSWIECLLHTYALTGLRRGEALGLRRSDLDFKAKLIYPRKNVKYVGTTVVLGNLKNKASQKPIPMTDELEAWLHEQLRRVKVMKSVRGSLWNDHNLVFPATNGMPMSPRNLHRAFKQLLAKAQLPMEFTIHGFRHSYGTLLGEQYSIKVVQELMRHADARSTVRYMHSSRSQERRAADSIADLLGTKRRKSS